MWQINKGKTIFYLELSGCCGHVFKICAGGTGELEPPSDGSLVTHMAKASWVIRTFGEAVAKVLVI
jgi:hypothetical protein